MSGLTSVPTGDGLGKPDNVDQRMALVRHIGVFGGSFDPPHLGHIICSRVVAEKLKLDRVLIIPVAVHPHKPRRRFAASEARWEMIRRMVEGDSLYQVSRCEIDREGVSYSVDTLEQLAQYPEYAFAKFSLLIGMDAARDFGSWHAPDRITEIADIAVMRRRVASAPDVILPEPWRKHMQIVDTPYIDMSSTDIRERVRRGLPVDYWVGGAVAELIHRLELYR